MRAKFTAVITATIAILLLFAIESLHAADKVSAPDFSKYPQTGSFVACMRGQTNAASHLHQRTNLLAITAYPAGGRCAHQYFVTESGQESDHPNVVNVAPQSSRRKQLSETNLTSLRAAIRELPAESVLPPIERLVIVSFRDGTNWVTRSYDDDALPKPMRQIYDIIGEQSESKNVR
jgi:hypothetical protein